MAGAAREERDSHSFSAAVTRFATGEQASRRKSLRYNYFSGGREGFKPHRSSLIMRRLLVAATFGTTRNTRPVSCPILAAQPLSRDANLTLKASGQVRTSASRGHSLQSCRSRLPYPLCEQSG